MDAVRARNRGMGHANRLLRLRLWRRISALPGRRHKSATRRWSRGRAKFRLASGAEPDPAMAARRSAAPMGGVDG